MKTLTISCEFFDYLEYKELDLLEREDELTYKRHLRTCDLCQMTLKKHQQIDAIIQNSLKNLDFKDINSEEILRDFQDIRESLYEQSDSGLYLLGKFIRRSLEFLGKIVEQQWVRYFFVALLGSFIAKYA